MKRVITFVILTAVALTFAPLTFAQNTTAVIRELTGEVEIKRPGTENWVAARVGSQVERSAIVSTGFKSTALIAIGNSTILVRPLTRLSLQELMNQDNTETVNMNLGTGRVRVDVNPPAGSRANFTAQSPSATASVRGTTFEIDTVSIRVTHGSVGYAPTSNTARAVSISAGQQTWVDADTGSAVAAVDAAEIVRKLPDLPGMIGLDAGGRMGGSQMATIRIGDIDYIGN